MTIIKKILDSKSIVEAYKAITIDFVKDRYSYESLIVGYLSDYALNKPKNKLKPKFETQEIIYIFNHLIEEVAELKAELKKEVVDYDRVLDETADIAALCSGIVAWVHDNKTEVEKVSNTSENLEVTDYCWSCATNEGYKF